MCVVYEVKSGDSIKAIAKWFTEKENCPVTTAEIIAFNSVAVPDTIDPGDSYIIPCPGNCCTDSSCSESDAAKATEEAVLQQNENSVIDEAGGDNSSYKLAVAVLATAVAVLGLVTLLQLRTIRTRSISSAGGGGIQLGGVKNENTKTMRESKSWLVQSEGSTGVV